MRRFFLTLLVLLAAPACWATVPIDAKEVEYRVGDDRFQGYLAWNREAEGKRPGILVVHEWWGHNEHALNQAERLARLGYTALALDMYGEGKTADHPKKAGEFAGQVRKNADVAEARFRAAMEVLKDSEHTDPERIGAIGYCFGGGIVLQMARAGVELDGVASFHGSLAGSKPEMPEPFDASILVLQGGADQMVPPEQVAEFHSDMEAVGADYQIVVYGGAPHSFTNPQADEFAERFGIPVGYDESADRQSWEAMKGFFERVFGEDE